ncbi:MAG: phosphoglycolate phosphatase [Steroidobacteraceae bacterium]
MPNRKQALLLDLDGTLLDTAPDMANALNVLLVEEGRAALPFADIRPVVSHGSSGLIRLAFGAPEENERQRLIKRFLTIYSDALAIDSQLFDGFAVLLEQVRTQGMRWGVVTNKPAWLTDPLLEQLGLHSQADCVVSGDTVSERKPHPLPLLHAAQLINVPPDQCLYVGDAERDIQSARAAGMASLVALWGYIAHTDQPHAWQADGMIEQPEHLREWLFE